MQQIVYSEQIKKVQRKCLDKLSEIWYNQVKRKEVNVMSLFDNYKVFNFGEGVPYISVTKNGVTFNKAVIMKLNYPEHVVLLINPEEKIIAIKACDATTPNSAFFYKKNDKKVLSVRWNSKDLLKTIQSITDWNLSDDSYRIEGSLIQEENAMLFDLKTSQLL